MVSKMTKAQLEAELEKAQKRIAVLESQGTAVQAQAQHDELHYRSLFEESPLCLWEEDYSAVKAKLDELKNSGVIDLREYMHAHPDFVAECATLIYVVNVNKATIKTFEAKKREDLLKKLDGIISHESMSAFADQLITLYDGQTTYFWEGKNYTLTGKEIQVHLYLSVVLGHEKDLSRVIISMIDVTKRKQAEDAQRHTEIYYRALFEQTHDAVFIMDFEGKFLAVNQRAADMLGYEPHELLGFSTSDTSAQEEQSIDVVKRIVNGEHIPLYERVFRKKDGTLIFVEINAEMVKDIDGKPLHIQSVVRDITERKRTENELKKSEAQYRLLADHMSDIVWLMDLELQVVYISPSTTKIQGYTLEELQSITLEEQMTAESFERAMAVYTDGFSPTNLSGVDPKLTYDIDLEFYKKDGSTYWSRNTFQLILDENGQPINILGIGHDITSKKLAEEELRKSEQGFRAITEDMPAMVCRFKEDGTITFVNSFYCNYFNASFEELVGTNLFLLIPASQREFVKNKYLSLDARTPFITYEYEAIDAEKRPCWQRWTDRALFNEQGELVEYQSIGEDITDRKETEQRLAESEARFRALIANTGDLIIVIDNLGNITFASPSCKRLFGYEPEEAIGNNFATWVHPDDLPEALIAFQSRREILGTAPQSIKVRGLHKDGSWRYIEALGTNLMDNPSIQGIVLNIRDVTEQKRAELEKQVLYEIMQGMALSQNLGEFLGLVHYSIGRVIRANNFFVSLYNQYTGLFEDAYCVDEYDEPFEPSRREGTLTSYIFRTGNPLLATEEKFKELTDLEEVTLIGVDSKSWIGVPLKTAGKTIGVMAVQDYEQANLYSEKELAFLASLSGQVASAVERKQAEERLHESEKRFATSFENAPISMALVEITGRMFKVNMAFCNLLGYSEEELISKTFQEITHPEDLETDLNNLDQLLAGKVQSYQMEKRYQHKLGHYVWGALNVSLVKNDDNTPLYFISQIQDITETKRANETLRESEKRYRSLFEDSPISLWEDDYSSVKQKLDELKQQGVTDFKEYFAEHPERVVEFISLIRILDANQYSVKLFNAKNKEDLIQNSKAFLSTEFINNLELINIANGLTHFEWEGINRTLSGELLNIKLTWSAAAGHEQDLSKVIISITDITEIKQAEEALHKSESLYRQAIEVAGAVPYYESYYGDKKQHIKYEFIGEGIRQITGYAPEEFTAKVWDSLVEEVVLVEELAGYSQEEGIERVREGEIPIWKSEFRIRDRQGNTHWVFESAVELRDENGSSHGSIGMYQDITMRKLAEAEIHRQLSELETLYESGLAISRLLTPREIAQKVIEILDRRMNWHHIAIRQYQPETNSVQLIAFNRPDISMNEADEFMAKMNEVISNPAQGLSGWVTLNGSSIRVPNVKDDERYVDVFPEIHSGLYVPLKIGEKVIGSISVESEGEDAFNENDERLLETLAGQAAIAIENANLFLTTQREIMERQQAEIALQKRTEELLQLNNKLEQRVKERTAEIEVTRKRLELAADAAGLGIWEWDNVNGKLIWDAQMYRIHGISQEEFSGKLETIYQYVIPQDQEIVSKIAYDVVVNHSSNYQIEYRICRKDGEIRTLTQQGVAIFDESHNIDRIIGTVNDITPQKQAEQAIRESEAYARLLFDASPDPVSVSEVDGKLLDVNRLFEQQHRIKRAEISGRNISELNIFPPEQLKKERAYIQAIVEGNEVPPVELDFYNPSGGIHTLEMHSYPIEVNRQMLILSTSRDITIHKKAEESLRLANAEMERALRVKDEFLANMSHELRTPLNAILGMSESLEEQIAGPLNEKQIKYIRTIAESGKHLLELINDILDLSKIEAGRLELNVSQITVSSLCEASLRMVKELAQKKGQQISLNIDPEVKIIMGDERRLKQSLVNLLSNAVKFTPNDRRLGVDVKGNIRNQTVVFTVWDEGIGMAPDQLNLIFKPFVQLDAGLAREFSGTGLGLVLVAQMIRLHGGSVSVESKEGVGSRFSITLPWVNVEGDMISAKNRPQNTEAGSGSEEKRGGKILIVEDTDSIILLLTEYLRYKGYQIMAAHNGMEGLMLAIKEKPDLILMDVMMPVMDGVEATKRIRAEKDLQEIPIIALTALAMTGDKERCLQAGMNDYLSKPVQMKELENLIAKHINRSKDQSTPPT
ncbi:MAG: PAS domain S-box protein [Anaerolineales bacterium]